MTDPPHPPAGAQTEQHARTFAGWRSQRGMLADVHRTGSFAQAIAALVRPGMTVIDVGTGSGILALLAARAGARQVYALEDTALIEDARAVAEANGLADRITFVRGDARDFAGAGSPADLVLGEWMGRYLFEEWQHFDAFAAVRDRMLRPGGSVMPQRVRVVLAPVDDSRLYMERGPGFWERPVWGLDFSLVHRRQLDRTRRIIVKADHHALLDTYALLELDCAHADARAFRFERRFETLMTHDAGCHGLIGWFEADLAPCVVLSTSPASKDTHWHQSYFPFEQLQLHGGDLLRTEVRAVPDVETGMPALHLRVEQDRAGHRLALREHRYTLHDTLG